MVDRGNINASRDLSFVNPYIRSQAPIDQIALLPPTFSPGNWDVICMGGKENYTHVGNRRFRICIFNNLNSYMKAKTKQQKSVIVSNIVTSIRESSNSGGGFIRQDFLSSCWFRVNDKVARDKVGQALRDAIKVQQSWSKKRDEGMAQSSKHPLESECSPIFLNVISDARKKRRIEKTNPMTKRSDERIVTENMWSVIDQRSRHQNHEIQEAKWKKQKSFATDNIQKPAIKQNGVSSSVFHHDDDNVGSKSLTIFNGVSTGASGNGEELSDNTIDSSSETFDNVSVTKNVGIQNKIYGMNMEALNIGSQFNKTFEHETLDLKHSQNYEEKFPCYDVSVSMSPDISSVFYKDGTLVSPLCLLFRETKSSA